jgi:serine/threonine-protein kinase
MKKCPQCGKEYKDTTTLCPSDGTVLERNGNGLVGQTLADKYKVEELINEGGMGAVYRGTHVLMDKTVAIKVLHPALAADDKIVARFSREARAASRISHPHALNVTDFGESGNGVVFLVMEYLRGKTLKEVVHDDSPMPLTRVVEIVRQVCGALEAAHKEGVVHRDLKSDNIMLVEVSGGGDWAKVLDFGIAKITEKVGQDPALTAPNLIIGTPQYMSPEQCSQASEIDARSDIYSFGIILYEMLAGHVPFTGESPTAIMMKHLQDAPPSILEERKDLPASVGRVVARALAKRPEERFQTVSEFSESLAQAAEDAAVVIASTNPGAADRDTNRILVPTGSNEAPRDTANDDYDEATIVRQRTVHAIDEPELFRDEIAPPESASIWRIVIPAVAGLLVLFGVIYALTSRNSGPTPANDNTMTVDPGGQPVQPAPPVTGNSEQGITPNAPVNSGNDSNNNSSTQGNTPPTQNSGEPPVSGNTSGNRNANQPQNDNNANDPGDEEPTPTPARNNNGRGETPPPQTTPTPADDADDPPPLPSPTQKKPRPTPPPAETNPKPAPGVSAPFN